MGLDGIGHGLVLFFPWLHGQIAPIESPRLHAPSRLPVPFDLASGRLGSDDLPGIYLEEQLKWWVYDGFMMVDGFKKRFLNNLDKPYKPRSGWLDPGIPSLVENESTSFLLFHVPFLQVWGVSREDCVLGKIKSKHCEHVESCWIMLITED